MAQHPPEEETEPLRGHVDHVRIDDPVPDWDRYAIVDELGEGGMGVVYRAIDRQLRRTVALKFLRSRDPAEMARFQREARAQASLDHEHICRVFEVGEVDGRAFMAMQFIEGDTLRSPSGELDIQEKLEVMEQVSRAVQAAHAGGVVHRDLKPGNIMVERRHDGRLHATVLDFGIAGASGAPTDEVAEIPMGTPAFMAPEQIRSDGGAIDNRVDVYGLGATLYAVLAEQAPFYGGSREETKAKVLGEEPLRLGLVVPGMSEDLETIIAVAMAKDPADRYPSARALADDLGLWLEGRPIRTRRAGPFYRFGTWMRTRRLIAASLALVVVTAGAAAGSALWLRYRENQRRALVAFHQNEVEQIDRLLRRARMMPLHDTTAAETAARQRLAGVDASLIATGPLARGPAYYALGFGHLMLREYDLAEDWLRAAVDSGFVEPEVETALGISLAMQLLDSGAEGLQVDPGRVEEAVRRLAASGPKTAGRDRFHHALGLFLEDRPDEALVEVRRSTAETSWLYEGYQLEGDILVARADRRRRLGDARGARSDLVLAGEAYGRGLEVARSDAWLHKAEAERLLRLIELQPPDEADTGTLLVRAGEAAARAAEARPEGEAASLRARIETLIPESHGANTG